MKSFNYKKKLKQISTWMILNVQVKDKMHDPCTPTTL